jgi:rod shape-determining protein MreD
VKTAAGIVAVSAALAVQTTLSGLFAGSLRVNLVLVAVTYLALAYGPVTGMLAGMAGGLVQDALAGGIVGIGGLSKTLIGFSVGVLGAQFIVSTMVPRLLMFMAATFVHELVLEGLGALVGGRAFSMHLYATLLQAIFNGVVGVLAFIIVENGPDLLQRRRMRRTPRVGKGRF